MSTTKDTKNRKKHKIYVVCGPTASGKSAFAMDIARQNNGVIINCDSLQIYDGLPILSAQPSEEDRAEIPHRLYATLHPNDVCSAGNWSEIAQPIIEETIEAGKTPVICGGTGLYIRALIDGLSPMPDIPDEVRTRVVAHHEDVGAEAFYAELKRRDPEMAARFHINHKARIIRAMEVIEATGKSLADWQKLPRTPPPSNWDFEIQKVIPARETLYKRCNDRFIHMFENGALDDVKTFDDRLKSGEVNDGVPLCKALGFKHLRAYLNNEMPKQDAITASQTDTRHYAKRQTTWFRNQI